MFYFVIYLFHVAVVFTPELLRKKHLEISWNLLEITLSLSNEIQMVAFSPKTHSLVGFSDAFMNDTNSVSESLFYISTLNYLVFCCMIFSLFLHNVYSKLSPTFQIFQPILDPLILRRRILSSVSQNDVIFLTL